MLASEERLSSIELVKNGETELILWLVKAISRKN